MAKRPPWIGDRGDIDNDSFITSDDRNRITNHLSGVTPITDAAALKRAICTTVAASTDPGGTDDSMASAISSYDATEIKYILDGVGSRKQMQAYTGLQKDGYGILYYNPVESSLSITAKNDKTIAAVTYDWDEVT